MLKDSIMTVIGLVIGLATGFYFERRSTRAAEEHAADLERELHQLRESVYSVGMTLDRPSPGASAASDLDAEILNWVRAHQDSQGRVRRHLVTTTFLTAGHSRLEIDEAVARLTSDGRVATRDEWLEM
jgi:hypothetical protein